MSVAGKHVVVTGGGSGAGAEIAQVFAGAGAKVTIMGRDREKLAAQGLAHQVCDVRNQGDVIQAFDAARAASGPISIVIANAGAAESAPFEKTTSETFANLLAVNLMGVAWSWQAALNDMKLARWGRLLAIASTAGLKGYPYVSAYSAAKHGVIGLTRSVALEIARSGITANAICPGFLETPMLARSVDNIVEKTGMDRSSAEAHLRAVNPQGRFITSGEVAETALWLCSEGAAGVNGHALSLSGGEI